MSSLPSNFLRQQSCYWLSHVSRIVLGTQCRLAPMPELTVRKKGLNSTFLPLSTNRKIRFIEKSGHRQQVTLKIPTPFQHFNLSIKLKFCGLSQLIYCYEFMPHAFRSVASNSSLISNIFCLIAVTHSAVNQAMMTQVGGCMVKSCCLMTRVTGCNEKAQPPCK